MTRVPPLETRFKKGSSGNPHGRPMVPEKLLFQMSMALLLLVLAAYKKDKVAQRTLLEIKKLLEIDNNEKLI